jgi:hypothetical protein
MKQIKQQYITAITWLFLLPLAAFQLGACKKLVAIDEPITTITSKEVFSTDAQATAAMAGVYSQMINPSLSFSNGAINFYCGYSADEFTDPATDDGTSSAYTGNRLTAQLSNPIIWNSAYTAIYGADAVIEGIAASTSPLLHDSIRLALASEARFVRAFSYFYLVNLYGDVPLVLTIDFNKTVKMARTPQDKVYEQIIADLKAAQAGLPADYTGSGGERIKPVRWSATALLARVYLYLEQWEDAAQQATDVISQTSLYGLNNDLSGVFLKNSTEAIWQLQQNTSAMYNGIVTGTATLEGFSILPNPLNTGAINSITLTGQLLNAFEAGDQRKTAWVNSTGTGSDTYYYPFKYRTGTYNLEPAGSATEYYMALRLAEQYLIRAEAAAHGAAGGPATAIADLNVLRQRAGLPGLADNLSGAALLNAVQHERQVELFAEWGHRWLDLKRTGQAHTVLSQITYKQPWQGDNQLLYPIPTQEIQADPLLIQNPGY